MSDSTIKEAVYSLGLTLLNRFWTGPFHEQEDINNKYTPNVREHYAAIAIISSFKKSQKATTQKLLWYTAYATSYKLFNNPKDHAADIIIGAFFFAMQSCKLSNVLLTGKTVITGLGEIRFYSNDYQLIPHHHVDLVKLEVFVWVLFMDQKNRLKCNTGIQMKIHNPLLCLINKLGRAVQHVL